MVKAVRKDATAHSGKTSDGALPTHPLSDCFYHPSKEATKRNHVRKTITQQKARRASLHALFPNPGRKLRAAVRLLSKDKIVFADRFRHFLAKDVILFKPSDASPPPPLPAMVPGMVLAVVSMNYCAHVTRRKTQKNKRKNTKLILKGGTDDDGKHY